MLKYEEEREEGHENIISKFNKLSECLWNLIKVLEESKIKEMYAKTNACQIKEEHR